MNRAQKEVFVKDLTKNITEAESFALMSFNKIKVEDMTLFRIGLRKKDVRVKVLKNTLAKRAFESTPYKDIVDKLQGPLLVAYGEKDPVISTKAIWEWVNKESFEVEVKSGAAFGKVLSREEMEQLSKLPGREELFVSFLWALKSAPTKFLYALQYSPRRLGYALHALKDKKEKEG